MQPNLYWNTPGKNIRYVSTTCFSGNFCCILRYLEERTTICILTLFFQDIAERMGFDTRKSSSLWKDRTLVEVNVAVLYSFQVKLAEVNVVVL